MILEKKLLPLKELASGVATFRDIARSLDLKSDTSSVLVYEGFGSSYEKARAAFSAIRLHFPNRRLITFFEPHTFSWRNKDTVHWYDDVFLGCDRVFIYEPATQGAQSHAQLSQDDIVTRVRKAGYAVSAFSKAKEGVTLLEKELSPNDV